MAAPIASPVRPWSRPPPGQHSEPRKVKCSDRYRLQLLAKNLQLRLSYARLKVQHGWHRQTLNEVENLYFRHFRTQSLAREAEKVKKELEVRRRGSVQEGNEAEKKIDIDGAEEEPVRGAEGAEGAEVPDPTFQQGESSIVNGNGKTPAALLSPPPLKPPRRLSASASGHARSGSRQPTESPVNRFTPFPSASTNPSPVLPSLNAFASPTSSSARATAGGSASAGPRTYEDFWKTRASPSRFSISGVASAGGIGASASPRTIFNSTTSSALSAATGLSSMPEKFSPESARGVFAPSDGQNDTTPKASGKLSGAAMIVPPTNSGVTLTRPPQRSDRAPEHARALVRAAQAQHASQASMEEGGEISLEDIDQMNWTS